MFPIVLAHGIARFDILREKLAEEIGIEPNGLDDRFQYFRNIRTHLNSNGYDSVHNTNVDFAGALELRSEQLRDRVESILAATGAAKVHIIAHSMGGLDARKMIVDLGMDTKVASLTTIGTPHLGTILADQMLEIGGTVLISVLEKAIHIDLDGFRDLTIAECGAFNSRVEDAEATNTVHYQTFSSSQQASDIFLPLLASWFAIDRFDGPNDGLVSVRSQQWKRDLIASNGVEKKIGQFSFPIGADHLNQVGWWDWQEAVSPLFGVSYANQRRNYEAAIKDIYLSIAEGLRDYE